MVVRRTVPHYIFLNIPLLFSLPNFIPTHTQHLSALLTHRLRFLFGDGADGVVVNQRHTLQSVHDQDSALCVLCVLVVVVVVVVVVV